MSHTALSLPLLTELPEFRGIQNNSFFKVNNPTLWLQTFDALARYYSWPGDIKTSLAKSQLHDLAKAWYRYDGSNHSTWTTWSAALVSTFRPLSSTYDDKFMRMQSRGQGPTGDATNYIYEKLQLFNDCGITWQSPTARQYVVDRM